MIDHDPETGHVTRPRYGSSKNTLAELFEFARKVGKMNNGWETAYFVRAFYDAAYGLADKMYLENYERKEVVSATRPLSMVSMNTAEGLMELNGFNKRFIEFQSFKVQEATGYNFSEWLELPTYQLEAILSSLRLNFQMREAEIERQRKVAEDMKLQGARDPQAVAHDVLAGGSKYRP